MWFRYAPSALLNQREVLRGLLNQQVRCADYSTTGVEARGLLKHRSGGAGRGAVQPPGVLEHGVGDQAQRVEAYLRVEGVGHADELVGAGVTLDL